MMAANAAIFGVRYHQRVEGSANEMDFDGGYDLRSGVRAMGSDFAYSRHRWEFRYTWSHGKQLILDDFTGGTISGTAPLYERFVLGNSTTLRGWSKYDIDPMGGNRMVHNSVEYRYGVFQAFYDSGAIWDSGEGAVPRNSVGVGLREGVFSLAVAFPVKEGRVDPVFMVSMNY
jgi:outer membrane protein assembly factor BamA